MEYKPYLPPRPLLCDPSDIKDGFPSMTMVDKYIDYHADTIRRYEYLKSLYAGLHDIYHQPDKAEWKPDNRLAVNFPKYITNISFGYGYGIPISKKFEDEKVHDSIMQIEKRIHIVDHDGRLF